MKKDDLIHILKTMGPARRENRDRCAQIVITKHKEGKY
jgi:hypothetical protein